MPNLINNSHREVYVCTKTDLTQLPDDYKELEYEVAHHYEDSYNYVILPHQHITVKKGLFIASKQKGATAMNDILEVVDDEIILF